MINPSSFLLNGNMQNYQPLQTEADEKDPFDLSEAIKAFKDKHLTGLTDEEREKIKREIEAYLMENKVETPEEIAAFQQFVESLYKKYGAFNLDDDFIENIISRQHLDLPAHIKSLGDLVYRRV